MDVTLFPASPSRAALPPDERRALQMRLEHDQAELDRLEPLVTCALDAADKHKARAARGRKICGKLGRAKKAGGLAFLAGIGMLVASRSVPMLWPVGLVVITSGAFTGVGSAVLHHCAGEYRDQNEHSYHRNYHDAMSYRDRIQGTLRPRIEATRKALQSENQAL
ncbi:MAG: hypothetical protein AMXMBFR33_23390 [Candidatus Xenobia bacterium]